MRETIAVLRGYRLAGFLVAISLASVLSACGGSNSVQSSAGVSCNNYSLHGAGKYRNEETIRVEVNNSTAYPVRYAIDVDLTAAKDGPSDTYVTISGSLASHASGELGRKVLTEDPIQRCQVIHITRQSQS
jgi:hypothetical protein